jgi:hypothetical protein
MAGVGHRHRPWKNIWQFLADSLTKINFWQNPTMLSRIFKYLLEYSLSGSFFVIEVSGL